MNDKILPARPIWLSDGGKADEYAEFRADFEALVGFSYSLLVAADSEYNVFCDGALVSFGQYGDYPGRLVYDNVSIPSAPGAHTLHIVSWHWGVDSFTHKKRPAHMVFLLRRNDGEVILASSPDTPSRRAPGYVPYKNHTITSQLGLMCEYSAPLADEMANAPFLPSAPAEVGTSDGSFEFIPRPISRCVMRDDTPMTVIKRGFYKFTDSSGDMGLMLDKASKWVPRSEADGCLFVSDVGAEETGFIKFLLKTTKRCNVYISWGEHLTEDGMTPRAAIHSRRFVYFCEARAGENMRIESLRRIGCRYLALFCSDPDAEISYLGLVPTRYPVERADVTLRPDADRRLYDCAVRTLELCMHEHYEDCPWREQSLYTLDSRTQMRCGYLVFRGGNAGFARASLDLISRSERPDGLLSICAPAGLDRPIPCYSLAYILQMKEYAVFSGDIGFIAEKMPLLERIMSVFSARRAPEHSGALRRFPDRLGYWNFYEWAKTLEGSSVHRDTPDDALPAEAPLTAFFALAAADMAELYARLAAHGGSSDDPGYSARARFYASLADEASRAITDVFFDRRAGFFRTFTDRSDAPFSVLTQALCLLAGAAPGEDISRALAAVADNRAADGDDCSAGLIPATLSSAPFRYDAVMRLSSPGDGFAARLFADFRRGGEYMLSNGATTLWETIKGAADFGGAGSLCHGWSSCFVSGDVCADS